MHHDWKIEPWKEEYVYTHIQVAHLRFRIPELPHYYQVEPVAFQVEVASVLVSDVWVSLVEVHPCFCVSSVSGDSVRCNFWQGRQPSVWFSRSIAGCLSIALFTVLFPRNSTPRIFSSWTSAAGFLIMHCVSSIVAHENPPLAILAIFKARRMSDCSGCSRPPCLATVADMLKTYNKSVAASTY